MEEGGQKAGKYRPSQGMENSPNPEKPKDRAPTRHKLMDLAKVSEHTIRKAEVVASGPHGRRNRAFRRFRLIVGFEQVHLGRVGASLVFEQGVLHHVARLQVNRPIHVPNLAGVKPDRADGLFWVLVVRPDEAEAPVVEPTVNYSCKSFHVVHSSLLTKKIGGHSCPRRA